MGGRSLTLKARMRLPALVFPLLLLVADLPCCTSKKSSHRSLPDASDLRVRGLEEVEPAFGLFEGEMYAGLLPMDNGERTGNLMFWLFTPDEPSITDSLVIWLNGGPGTYLPTIQSRPKALQLVPPIKTDWLTLLFIASIS
jgi:hypothetical protein